MGPNCRCGLPAELRTVRKSGPSLGRHFYGCPRFPAPDECKFFAWAPPGVEPPLRQPGAGSGRGGGSQPLSPGAARHGSQQQPGGSQPGGSQQQRQQVGSPYAGSQPGSQAHTPVGRRPPATFSQTSPGAQPAPGGGSGRTAGGEPVRVELQVVNSETFGAGFHFNYELKEYLKSLPPPCLARWDQARRLWTFSLSQYEEVLRRLQQEAPCPVHIVPIPAAALERFRHVQQAEQPVGQEEVEERLARIPPDIWDKLYGFQREGVRYVVQHGGRALIADEMGLGKTVQALCAAACFGPEDWPLLIVCPSTMKLVWRDAVLDWLPPALQPEPGNLVVIKDGKSMKKAMQAMDPDTPVRIVIVSYEMVKKMEEELHDYKTVICDESHHLKSMNAQRTKCMDNLVQRARRAILMTGTPALSRPIELYPQINMLRPGLFGSFDDFGMRYCGGKPAMNRFNASPSGMDYQGSSCEGELHALLHQHLVVRRLKAEVLSELPEKVRSKVPVEVDPEHRVQLLGVQAEMRALEADSRLSEDEVAQRRQQLLSESYRLTGPAKCQAAVEHIRGLLESGEKVLIFAHHQEVLDRLQEEVMETGDRKFVRIDGQVVNERRKAAVDTFQTDDSCRAALLSITAAGVGITLTAATVVVFVELFWNPGHLIQAEDRAHRVGQRHSLRVHYLLAEGSADDIVWPLCNRKLKVVGRSVAGATGLEKGDSYRTAGELLARQAAHEAGVEEAEEWYAASPPQQQQQQQQFGSPGGDRNQAGPSGRAQELGGSGAGSGAGGVRADLMGLWSRLSDRIAGPEGTPPAAGRSGRAVQEQEQQDGGMEAGPAAGEAGQGRTAKRQRLERPAQQQQQQQGEEIDLTGDD